MSEATFQKDKLHANGWKVTGYLKPSPNPEATMIKNLIQDFGQYEGPDGTRVQGEFKNNKLDGIGYTKHADGQEFIGEYQNGKRQGMGSMYLGDRMFTGKFAHGEIERFGEMEMQAKDTPMEGMGADLPQNLKPVK